MTRPYTGSSDAPGTRLRPGLTELSRLINKTWGFKFIGGFVNRKILSGPSKGQWSVHATGRAIDMRYPSTRYGRNQAVQVWVWLLQNTQQLQIEEIHDYAYQKPGDPRAYGRGYRCSRGEGCAGVIDYTAKVNAGSLGGNWLHIELSPFMADDAKALREAWKAIPKPQPLLKPKTTQAR